ncbi:MAG TPA: hypothetical protein DGG95_10380 [Cytophagales bacterium]|nr:hypothetical protein [Cytophagales bacterium]
MFLGEYDLRKKSMLKKKRIHMGNPDPFYKALIHIPSLQQLVVTDQEKGLVFFDYDFEETAQYPTHTILGSSSKEIIFHHASLKDNCLWMSTDPFGVIQCSLSDKPFYHFKPSRKTAVTKGIFTDAEGNVYGALLNEGLVKFDKNGNEMPELESEKEPFQFQAFNTIFSIAPDSVFIHCFNYLGYYNTRAKAFNNFKPYFLQATKSDLNLSFYNQSVRIRGKEFLTSSDRKLWYLHFSEKDLKVKLVSEFPHPISAICSSKDGTFLVGTIQGLYVWKKNKIEFIEPIGTRFIKHILQDGHGHFWISTIDGLWLLDENLKVMKAFSTQNGLLNNFIYGTVESNQEIWGSSNYGLFRIDPAHEKISTYQITDGLQSNEFNSGTFFKSHDGKIFFGGINGINLINDHFQKNFSAEFNTVITSLKINDHADSTRAPWTLTNLHLPHEKNTLSFSFAGLFPSQSDRLIYRYKMQGSDRDWVYSGKERTARYASLSPGSYQFKVAASMNGEDWKSESIVSIFIAPPFWLTWWFRAFLVIALAIIIAGIVRLIQHRKVKREIEKQKLHLQLEEERQRISRDLHDNMGAYTSALLSNVQQMQQKTDETFAKDLAHMQQNAEQILSSLRETIWVLNNKSISVQDFADAFKSNCLKLLRSFQGIHLDAQEHITTSYILSAPTAIHLNKILMEAVQNTLKHAQAKNIIVIIHCGEQLLIEIKDDGVGFETERGTGNGLHNMEWRASQAGFRFQFFSEKGKGTRIELVKNIGSEKI